MSVVVNIHGEAADIDTRCAAVAQMYEGLAARARNGEIAAAATAFVRSDGTIGTMWETAGSLYPAIGAVSVLIAEMTGARDTE